MADLVKSGRKPCHLVAPGCEENQMADTSADVWGFGILVYEIFARRVPFAEVLLEEIFSQQGEGQNVLRVPTMSLSAINCRDEVVRRLPFTPID